MPSLINKGKSKSFLFHFISPHSLLRPCRLSLLQSLLGEGGQDEAGLVDLGVVVAALLLLLLGGPAAQGDADVAVGILAADHEADLAGGVGGDGGVGVLGDGEDLLAVLLQLGDERKMEPLVLSYTELQELVIY